MVKDAISIEVDQLSNEDKLKENNLVDEFIDKWLDQ